jgi:uncharacterized membrane protein
MKESVLKILALFTNRAFISAVFIVAGSLAMLWGRSINFNEQLIDALVTIAGGLLTVFGYAGALYTPAPKSQEKK